MPAYAKDRCPSISCMIMNFHILTAYHTDVASTSPPNAKGFISGSYSSNDSSLGGYEVEVVEIRVKEGEFDDILH